MPSTVTAAPPSGQPVGTRIRPANPGAQRQVQPGGAPGAKPPATVAGAGQKRARRPYLYALDPIRVVTALSVLAVHVFEFSAVLNTSALASDIQIGASSALHFTREIFMFTTAFVLVYTYAGASFNVKTFLRKRGLTVVLPYALWSVVYVAFNAWMHQLTLPPLHFVLSSAKAVLTGSASYQLYFILLSIQFYALFPLLLRLLPWLRAHARSVLTISLVLEIAFLAFDFVFLENLHAAPIFTSAWAARINSYIDFYQDRFVLVYQFYFLLGAILALNVERVGAFLLAHGRAIVVAFGLTLCAFWLNFAFAVWAGHDTMEYATAVLQPAMVPYSVVVLAFLGYLACRWAPPSRIGEAPARPYAATLWHTLADSTFGIYLVHPVFLTLAMAFVAPALPTVLPVPVRVAVLLLLVAGSSVGASVLLLRTPGLSGLVGRPSPLPMPRDMRVALVRARAGAGAALGELCETLRQSRLTAHARLSGRSHVAALAAGDSWLRDSRPGIAIPVRQQGRRLLSQPQAAAPGEHTRDARPPADLSVDMKGERPGGSAANRDGSGSHLRARVSGPRRAAERGEREQRLRRAYKLKQEGWRQREIAAALGVSRSTVSYWLKHGSPDEGRSSPGSSPGSYSQD